MNIFNPRRNERGNTDGIFRMEFPLMQWLVAALYFVFGPHLEVSRCFMFLLSGFSVFGMYYLLKALFRKKSIALIGSASLTFSPSFYYYAINPLPDNMALCCGIWGLAFFFDWLRNPKAVKLIMSGLLLSIGALCKLPFIIYFGASFFFFIQLAIHKGIDKAWLKNTILHFGFGVLPIAWYASVIRFWGGNMVLKGVTDTEDSFAQLFDYFLHNTFSTLPELLLNYAATPLFLIGLFAFFQQRAYQHKLAGPILFLCSLCVLYFFYEINAIADIHDYYLFPFLPLLFILVGFGGEQLLQSSTRWHQIVFYVLMFALPITCHLRMASRWNPERPGFNKDLLLYKEALQEAVPNDSLVVVGNDISHFISFYYIDKKGWGFHADQLTADQLSQMIDWGARYLYCDSRVVDSKPEIQEVIETKILEKGSIHVYRLKD